MGGLVMAMLPPFLKVVASHARQSPSQGCTAMVAPRQICYAPKSSTLAARQVLGGKLLFANTNAPARSPTAQRSERRRLLTESSNVSLPHPGASSATRFPSRRSRRSKGLEVPSSDFLSQRLSAE